MLNKVLLLFVRINPASLLYILYADFISLVALKGMAKPWLNIFFLERRKIKVKQAFIWTSWLDILSRKIF